MAIDQMMTWIMAPKAHKHLWPYAMRHAVYISNMLPTMALGKHTTPYIALLGIVPYGSHVKVWGCDMYALLYSETRKKFGPEQEKASTLVRPNLC